MTQDRSQDVLTLREKLRQIRDSDHPASPWAAIAVQTLDEQVKFPDGERDHANAMRMNATLLAVGMAGKIPNKQAKMTPDELARCFGLGVHSDDHQ